MTKSVYWVREYFKDGKLHEMRIGKQLKRAKDTAEMMLNNMLINKVDIFTKNDDGTTNFVSCIFRG